MSFSPLTLAALDATLRLHRDPERAVREIPVLGMLSASEAELAERAERLRAGIATRVGEAAEIRIARAAGRAGGGALPLLELDGPVVALAPRSESADDLAQRLRLGDPPIVARVREDVVLLDPRTISEVEIDFAVKAAAEALLA